MLFPRSAWIAIFIVSTFCFVGSVSSVAMAQESANSSPVEDRDQDTESDSDDYGQISLDQPIDPADQEDQYKGVEEILVTAQAGGQNLQDVGVSAATFDADYLEAIGAQNITDISQFTPNLDIRSAYGAANPTLFIRGVGLRDFNANSQSAVAVYNDDIYMNSPAGQLGQFFDLQGVEVLRGPQGALYGRNASAGAINISSRKPTGDYNGYGSFNYGRFQEYEAEGAVEVPITDVLFLRVAGKYRERRGTTQNRCGDPAYVQPVEFRQTGPATGFAPIAPYGLGEDDPWIQANGQPNPYAVPFPQAARYYDPAGGDTSATGCFNRDTSNQANFDLKGLDKVAVNLGDAPIVPMWVNRIENWAGRVNLRFQPNEKFDFLLNIHGGMNRGDARQFQSMGATQLNTEPRVQFARSDQRLYGDFDVYQNVNGNEEIAALTGPEDGDPFAGDYNLVDSENLDLFGGYLAGDIQIADGLLFKTITGYEGNQRDTTSNLDGSPQISLEPVFKNEAWQVTQEFKLIWDSRDDLVMEVGAMYLHENLDVSNLWTLDQLTNITQQDYQLETDYGGLYGWMSWAPSDWFSIDIGGRWNFESKVMDIQSTQFDAIGTPVGIGRVTASTSVSDGGPSGSITFNFKPTEEHLVYLKYSHGYKGPHINGLILNPNLKVDDVSLFSPVKPEQVDALELGSKTTWFDNQLTFNWAAFYYDYQDIQIFQLSNSQGSVPVQTLINANDADIFGVEFDARAQPLIGLVPEEVEGLELFVTFGWLNSTYTDFSVPLKFITNQGTEITTVEDYSGNRLINSPEWAFAGYAQWAFTSSYGTLIPRFDWTFKSEVFFNPENDPLISQPAFWLTNFRLGYQTPAGNMEVAFWVKNVTDKVYRLDVLNLARFRGTILYAMGDPRTYGISFQVRF